MNQNFPEIHEFSDSFDKTILEHQRLGREYAKAKALSWKMQELCKSILAGISSQFEGSEASKERKARASAEYKEYIDGVSVAIEKEHEAKIDFDNADMRFESLRSLCSLDKKQMQIR